MEVKEKQLVKKYYDSRAERYHEQYTDKDYKEHPSNQIRQRIVLSLLRKRRVKSIFDVGCGTCIPIIQMVKSKFKVKGIDFSKEMIRVGKKRLSAQGIDPGIVYLGDFENASSRPREKFDAVTALGVFPHNIDDDKMLKNINSILKRGGRTIIEFRNELFSLFTFNSYSQSFFLEHFFDKRLVKGRLRREIERSLAKRFDMYVGSKNTDDKKISYQKILASFHNPLTIDKLFKKNRMELVDLYFYHFHYLPPYYEHLNKKEFNKLSQKLEDPSDWRGYFVASAFLAEAKKK